jgi:uncharacterized membrane protein YhhN
MIREWFCGFIAFVLTQLVAVIVFCRGASALVRGATGTFFGVVVVVVVVGLGINDFAGLITIEPNKRSICV